MSKTLKITHAVQVEHTDTEGVKRQMVLRKLEDHSYGLAIITKWPDEADEFRTFLHLTEIGRGLLTDLLVHGDKIDAYPQLSPAEIYIA